MPAPVGFSVDQVSSRYRERPLAARTARKQQQVQVGMPRTGANCDENRHARARHAPIWRLRPIAPASGVRR